MLALTSIVVLLAACADDAAVTSSLPAAPPTQSSAPAGPSASGSPTTASVSTAAVSTAARADSPTTDADVAASPTTEVIYPDIEIPGGILAAMPFQNRQDVPAHLFQVELVNHGTEQLRIVGVQFRWAGFRSPVTTLAATVVPGEIIDYPLPFAGATCAGDGTIATMPALADARARLLLDDGTERLVPVFDHQHFAARLYLEDCERQLVAASVGLAWTGLHTATFEGRPVTEGTLQISRRAATAAVSVTSISNTINFSLDLPSVAPGASLATLSTGEDHVEFPVRFVEGRCDYHAVSESSQPFSFIVHVDLGDGHGVRPFLLMPSPADQTPMTTTVLAGCAALGKLETLGPKG